MTQPANDRIWHIDRRPDDAALIEHGAKIVIAGMVGVIAGVLIYLLLVV